MKTFVCLWLLAVIISQNAGHGFIVSESYENLSKKLESLPTFELMNSLNQFQVKEKFPSKVMSPLHWQKQIVTTLDGWGQLSWGINVSEPFSYARSLFEDMVFGSSTLADSENNFIYHVIDLLEKDDLHILQRIWIVGVLRILQDHSPTIKHPLLSNCIQQGPLCRAGLELSLTQNFDLGFELPLALGYPDINESMRPCFKRVELLVRINRWAQQDSKGKISEGFKMIYDSLLQLDCPIKPDESILLANRCWTHLKTRPECVSRCPREARWTYGVLYHLYSSCKELREIWKGEPKLQAIQQSISKQMRYREVIKDDMKMYFSSGNVDPFITNLITPFSDILPINLKHYRYIIDCFEAQRKETHPSQSLEYWSNASQYYRFTYQKGIVVRVLWKASPYIQGAQQYLASRLKITNTGFQFIPLEGLSMANHNKGRLECAICLNEFVLGEHCIKLNCSPKHKFHHKCLVVGFTDQLNFSPIIEELIHSLSFSISEEMDGQILRTAST
ncbi:hypothetical protein DFH28DRAFT_136004 [Melampsora americana]|nr:hypothetical protein DFH28DRAFT_136004 [Melampsora americana]